MVALQFSLTSFDILHILQRRQCIEANVQMQFTHRSLYMDCGNVASEIFNSK